MSKGKNVGADLIVRFQDGTETVYKLHFDVPREDVERLKGIVDKYIQMATSFPALLQMLIAKLK